MMKRVLYITFGVAVFYCLFFLFVTSKKEKDGAAEAIIKTFMAANIQDFERANRYLSILERPQLEKTISGVQKVPNTFIDWDKITQDYSIRHIEVTKKPMVKMTEGLLYNVAIHYEKGLGRMEVTVLKEGRNWRLTFYKIHLIHHYIDSFRNEEEGGENDSDMIKRSIMAANKKDFKKCLSSIDRSYIKIETPDHQPVFEECHDYDVLTENKTVNRIKIQKIGNWHLTDGNIYNVELFYENGSGKVILSTVREKGNWKLTFVNHRVVANYITWP